MDSDPGRSRVGCASHMFSQQSRTHPLSRPNCCPHRQNRKLCLFQDRSFHRGRSTRFDYTLDRDPVSIHSGYRSLLRFDQRTPGCRSGFSNDKSHLQGDSQGFSPRMARTLRPALVASRRQNDLDSPICRWILSTKLTNSLQSPDTNRD